jgi:hypothetical protein
LVAQAVSPAVSTLDHWRHSATSPPQLKKLKLVQKSGRLNARLTLLRFHLRFRHWTTCHGLPYRDQPAATLKKLGLVQ